MRYMVTISYGALVLLALLVSGPHLIGDVATVDQAEGTGACSTDDPLWLEKDDWLA